MEGFDFWIFGSTWAGAISRKIGSREFQEPEAGSHAGAVAHRVAGLPAANHRASSSHRYPDADKCRASPGWAVYRNAVAARSRKSSPAVAKRARGGAWVSRVR